MNIRDSENREHIVTVHIPAEVSTCNLRSGPNFDPAKKNEIHYHNSKKHLKITNLQSLVAKCQCKVRKIYPCVLCVLI